MQHARDQHARDQHARDTVRVEMRDRLGRVTAILDEIELTPNTDYHRLAKRTFLDFQAPHGAVHYSCHVLAGNREIGSYSRRNLILET
jgi:hypothetical protein